MRSLTLAKKIGQLTLTKKAGNVIIMDLRKLTSMVDYFVVCSADSDVQVRAIAEAVERGMENAGVNAWHNERGSANWVLLDYVDVVLHVFHKQTRTYYSLERLWGDAGITHLDDEKKVSAKKATTKTVTKTVKKTVKRIKQKAM